MTATARRGHGEGSVYRDATNGTWVGAISLGGRPDGSRIRRKVTGRTKTEVREKLTKLLAETEAGLKTSASYTVAKAVDDRAAEALDGLAENCPVTCGDAPAGTCQCERASVGYCARRGALVSDPAAPFGGVMQPGGSRPRG
ncbi:MAG: hypothetical protein ACRDPF_08410 [Streptosporangiaceae bacterium]